MQAKAARLDSLSLITMATLLGGVFAFCGWVIKRHFIDRRWLGEGSRFIGRNVYSQRQNGDEQDRIEHIVYMEEEERDETSDGELLTLKVRSSGRAEE